jgi:integrase
MSRRLSAIRFAARLRNQPDPTASARVVAVWEGIRRTHGAPPEQAAPLMPPELFDVLAGCPTTKVFKTRDRSTEPALAGRRDRALLPVGFVAALRRSELAAPAVADVAEHANGLVLSLPRSKTNQTGEQAELVVLPGTPARCPVTALQTWLAAAGITDGPVFRPGCRPRWPGPGWTRAPYSAHSLRAGFVAYAHLRGASDRAIAYQTRHRSLASLGGYVRISTAWADNADQLAALGTRSATGATSGAGQLGSRQNTD